MYRIYCRLFILAILSIAFMTDLNAQQPQNLYEKEWREAEVFIDKGLPKSALTTVQGIYKKAKAARQEAQVLKALIYIADLQTETREDNEALSIAELEKEVPGTTQPARAVLHSIIATKYHQYLQMHRYEFYNRTNTEKFDKKDINTWTLTDLHRKIGEQYLASLQEERLLQNTRLEKYDALIDKGNMRHLRPTLFDLLAHQALNYFVSNERDIQRPAYAFELNTASAFDPAADFIHRKFETKDSLSLQHKALLIYQQLIAFHLADTRHDALVDVDLDRIEFVRSNSVHPDADQLYFNAINHIAHQYGKEPVADQASYLVAAYLAAKAGNYQPHGDTTHQFDKAKAAAILQDIIQRRGKDSTEGKINAINLLATLRAPSLRLEIEKVNVPRQPFRALVSYANAPVLYLRIIKQSEKLKSSNHYQGSSEYWKLLLAAPAVRNWNQALPDPKDLQNYRTEIKIDALPAGEYKLLASTSENFNDKSPGIVANFYVSSISFINSGPTYFILDRESGKPLAGAAVQVWEMSYDNKLSRYVPVKKESYKSGQDGSFTKTMIETVSGKRVSRNQSFLLDITHNGERFFMDDASQYVYARSTDDVDQPAFTTFLFTDRGLYRPGQTIHFKGISVIKQGAQKGELRTGHTGTIVLEDVNGQEVDSMRFTTNEYGSFNGRFQLPTGVLNGTFTLRIANESSQSYVQVEEYKRPKFEVDYETLTQAYKVNDTITVIGNAKAYAGNNIDGAKVSYRVVRQPRFLYPWYFRSYFPPSTPLEIVHGETITDRDGKFTIKFNAIPDLKLDSSSQPVFDYTVYADVTDINGETRSGEQTVTAGYRSFIVRSEIPERVAKDSLHTLAIHTENMNGSFVPTNISVSLFRLTPEQRLIRSRFWQRPNQFIYSKEEYIRLFPHDEYDNETDWKTWPREARTAEVTGKTDSVKGFTMAGQKPAAGFYVLEITAVNERGEQVKDIRYVELFDAAKPGRTRPEYLFASSNVEVLPGTSGKVEVGSSANDVHLLQETERPGAAKQPVISSLKLNNETKNINVNATENDRGGYGLSWYFVKHNRLHTEGTDIVVPWLDKQLTIDYATYRDKTLPGSEEKWKVKISGYKKEAKAAELLASMYDVSLDQFYPFNWATPSIWQRYYRHTSVSGATNFTDVNGINKYVDNEQWQALDKRYDSWSFAEGGAIEQKKYMTKAKRANGMAGARKEEREVMMQSAAPPASAGYVSFEADAASLATDTTSVAAPGNDRQNVPPVTARKNFNETAFFIPDLRTDSSGAIEFSFTMPEALTRWKFQALAHTKDLAFGYSSKEIITQKELMVQPNAPRFIREGDKMEFSAKIVNLSAAEFTGQARLELLDAATNQPLDSRFRNILPSQYFTVGAGQSEAVRFPIEIPFQVDKAITWRIIAQTGNLSDGEENILPVLSSRMLVTETMTLPMRGSGTATFNLDKLINNTSPTLKHQGVTVEYTSNPAWYAIQSLPYLMEYPYECAEQNWNRYYATTIAGHVLRSAPRIAQVFEEWKKDSSAFLSNLQKNEELKSILLEETPWVLQAKTDAERKKNLALLFDLAKLKRDMSANLDKLKKLQLPNGAFPWFAGGPDDRYITQYIVTGIGHLRNMGAIKLADNDGLNEIAQRALAYLDSRLKQQYDELKKRKTVLKDMTASYTEIQYFYMRSFFPEIKVAASVQPAYNFYKTLLPKNWTARNKYMQGMTAIALHRLADKKTPAAILKSLKETAIIHPELGMYWKDASRSWWWYQAPIERQALMIEAFSEISKETKVVDDLRTWLLKNKQTNNWESTKATAEACYALLLKGSNWLAEQPGVTIRLGNEPVITPAMSAQSGTGYVTTTIPGEKVTNETGRINVTVAGAGTAAAPLTTWGGVYWQYFEDLDKITSSATPLKLEKKLFIQKNTDRGPVLTPVNDGDALKIGDKIIVRIELRVDRDMEYIHMKDMRASAMEPVNVLSGYKYQGKIGYYETTKDASTSFFISNLYKGTYVFEYPLFVTHAGNFSNGITTIQSMYAPEFSAHSEGIRVNVEQ